MFDITWLGVPLLIVGFAYILVAAKPMSLKDRRPAVSG